ncbi:uncharacterized protein LOC128930282 isoform X1 [Callithrix jacchus]
MEPAKERVAPLGIGSRLERTQDRGHLPPPGCPWVLHPAGGTAVRRWRKPTQVPTQQAQGLTMIYQQPKPQTRECVRPLRTVPCTSKVLGMDLLNKRSEWISSMKLQVPERDSSLGRISSWLAEEVNPAVCAHHSREDH